MTGPAHAPHPPPVPGTAASAPSADCGAGQAGSGAHLALPPQPASPRRGKARWSCLTSGAWEEGRGDCRPVACPPLHLATGLQVSVSSLIPSYSCFAPTSYFPQAVLLLHSYFLPSNYVTGDPCLL